MGEVARSGAPTSDGGQLSLDEAKAGSWPSAEEALTRLGYARFSLTWLHEQGVLPADFNFAFEGEGFLNFQYNDTFKGSWMHAGYALLAEAPLTTSGGSAGPIQFYRGGVSTSDVGNFRTYAHEVLHRNPMFSIPYESRQQSLNQIHRAMVPIVDAAKAVYMHYQGSIDSAWGG